MRCQQWSAQAVILMKFSPSGIYEYYNSIPSFFFVAQLLTDWLTFYLPGLLDYLRWQLLPRPTPPCVSINFQSDIYTSFMKQISLLNLNKSCPEQHWHNGAALLVYFLPNSSPLVWLHIYDGRRLPADKSIRRRRPTALLSRSEAILAIGREKREGERERGLN